MYKNMYNPMSKINLLLLLSFIATMLVEVQGENKQKIRSEPKRMIKLDIYIF